MPAPRPDDGDAPAWTQEERLAMSTMNLSLARPRFAANDDAHEEASPRVVDPKVLWFEGPREEVPVTRIRTGGLTVDLVAQVAFVGHERLFLTKREFSILALLTSRLGDVVTRAELLSIVWGDREHESNTMTVHITRLRDKLGRERGRLETVRRAGYRLRA
jgi:DNA-binding response OmpR family regulator